MASGKVAYCPSTVLLQECISKSDSWFVPGVIILNVLSLFLYQKEINQPFKLVATAVFLEYLVSISLEGSTKNQVYLSWIGTLPGCLFNPADAQTVRNSILPLHPKDTVSLRN